MLHVRRYMGKPECVGYSEYLWCDVLLNMYFYVNHMKNVVLIEWQKLMSYT
jgi:hypothetical protein